MTGSGIETNRRLDDFVRERADDLQNPIPRSWFGQDREGEIIDPWRLNYQRLGFFAGSYVLNDFGPDACVMVEVPDTETGVAPAGGRTFGWSGQINEHLADRAVWWAFEILSEREAREFFLAHRPSVLFRFVDGGRMCELETKFDGAAWMVTRIA
jgi:hypothetical protein